MEFSSRGIQPSTGHAESSPQLPLAASWNDGLEPALVAKLNNWLAATVREGRQKLLAGEADKAAASPKPRTFWGPRFEEWAAACLNDNLTKGVGRPPAAFRGTNFQF